MMSNIKIQNLPLLTPLDAMKIPTGGFGDYAITVNTLANYLMTSRDIATTTQLLAHSSNTNNPHSVTKEQVGLGSVDNTSDIDKPVSTLQQAALDLKEDKNKKGIANGYASLDADGKVPQSQLPSYTDDVVNADSFALLPVSGELGKIYITTDTNNIYRWNGVEYVDLNTLGVAKYADQLTVAKSITAVGDANWSVDFNGTTNVSGTLTLANTGVSAGTYPKVTVDEKGRVTSGAILQATDLPSATVTTQGAVQLVNDLTTGGTTKALTAEQGKILMASFEALKQTSGYQKLPSGLIIQWGTTVSGINNASVTVNYPIAFPNGVLCVQLTANDGGSQVYRLSFANETTTNFKLYCTNTTVVTVRFLTVGW